MFQFLSSLGASTSFEKWRLQITGKNFQAPSEQSLRGIVSTFSGQDPEVKSQIAFATIVKKLLTSDSRAHWLYLLKNLIILDRIVEEGFFAEEVAGLQLASLDGFRETDPRNAVYDSERVIASFWRLVKEKSAVVARGGHVFCYKRSQRTEFLSKLKAAEVLGQIQSIEGFFAAAFELVEQLSGRRLVGAGERVERGREEWERSRLLEFLYLQVLHKLMLFYSCQLLCHQAFLQLLPRDGSLGGEEVRRFKRHVLAFRLHANEYVRFVEARKHIKGFEELNYKELNPFKGDDILRLLDAFVLQKEGDADRPLHRLLSDQQMRVEKKPFAGMSKDALAPRIRERERQGKEGGSSCFSNWSNSFSNSFPQSEVLSVDLIMEMRREGEGEGAAGTESEAVDDSNRESVMYGNRDTNVSSEYEVSYRLRPMGEPVAFGNQFSDLPTKWNA